MNSNSIKDNNFFFWTHKEESLDAMVAWLLWDEKAKADFVEKLTGERIDISGVLTQHENMDVFADGKDTEGNLCAVIIENKTDTTLHDDQHLKYIEKVLKRNYDKIYFVYIKIGTVFFWENDMLLRCEQEMKNTFEKSGAEIVFRKIFFSEYKEIIGCLETCDDHLKGLYDCFLEKLESEQVVRWNTNLSKVNREDFERRILEGIYLGEDIHTDYGKVSSSGKRDSKLIFYGYCGKNAKARKADKITLSGNYYLLPRIYIENKVKIDLKLHLYADSKSIDGYVSANKLKSKVSSEEFEKYKETQREIAKQVCGKINRKNWQITKEDSIKEDTLNILTINIPSDDNYEDICTKINEELKILIPLVEEIREYIESRN